MSEIVLLDQGLRSREWNPHAWAGLGYRQSSPVDADSAAAFRNLAIYFTPNKTDINKKYDPKPAHVISVAAVSFRDVNIEMTDKDLTG